MKLIPAIDLHNGKCVRLHQGNFDRVTEYDVDAVSLAQRYADLNVADLHIVDLDGARDGEQAHQVVVRQVIESSKLSVQLGGGIRSAASIESWLDVGVSRVVIGSIAISAAETVVKWIHRYGPDAIVLALDVNVDANGKARVATHGWQRQSNKTLNECLEFYTAAGAQHILCTDISRDGALLGPNAELYASLLLRYPDITLQASGGIRSIDDMRVLRELGATAAISGRALLDDRISAKEIRSFLRAA